MKTTLVIITVTLVCAGLAYWFFFVERGAPSQPLQQSQSTQPDTVTALPEEETSLDIPPGMQEYRNDEWGFRFLYPDDWEIREPAFGSAVSEFNMAVEPTDYVVVKAIIINITPSSWMIPAMADMRSDGVVFSEVALDGQAAFQYESTMDGAPTMGYLVERDGMWFNLKGKNQVRHMPEEDKQILPNVMESLELY